MKLKISSTKICLSQIDQSSWSWEEATGIFSWLFMQIQNTNNTNTNTKNIHNEFQIDQPLELGSGLWDFLLTVFAAIARKRCLIEHDHTYTLMQCVTLYFIQMQTQIWTQIQTQIQV